jgi:hypothetical protein
MTTSDNNNNNYNRMKKTNWSKVTLFGLIVFLAHSRLHRWVGRKIQTLVPVWPPSDAVLQPVLEDSHNTFFHLCEVVLQNNENAAPYVQLVRLAGNSLAEAWNLCLFTSAFGMIHVEPIVGSCAALGAVLGINLTNAFLAPYLLVMELHAAATAAAATTAIIVIIIISKV